MSWHAPDLADGCRGTDGRPTAIGILHEPPDATWEPELTAKAAAGATRIRLRAD